jgi:hypothetical protein
MNINFVRVDYFFKPTSFITLDGRPLFVVFSARYELNTCTFFSEKREYRKEGRRRNIIRSFHYRGGNTVKSRSKKKIDVGNNERTEFVLFIR